jgi:methionine biosynthesis protein MetW
LARGRMPMTANLAEPWWSTDNIHLCTLKDFVLLCGDLDLRIEEAAALDDGRPARRIDPASALENWRAEQTIFLLSR